MGKREAKGAAQSLGPGQDIAKAADNSGNLARADTDTRREEKLNFVN